MFYILLILTILFYYNVHGLVTLLCNDKDLCDNSPLCLVEAGCVLFDNGELKMAQHNNTYPTTYISGGFYQNGYHVEYYFGEYRYYFDEYLRPASIYAPNGNNVSRLNRADPGPGNLYFAFKDKSVQEAANDARSACNQLNQWPVLALPCDDIYQLALREYKPNYFVS